MRYPAFLIPASNPAPRPIVPNGVNAFTMPSIAFTPVVPRSTKNFSKSLSKTVFDNDWNAASNCFVFAYL